MTNLNNGSYLIKQTAKKSPQIWHIKGSQNRNLNTRTGEGAQKTKLTATSEQGLIRQDVSHGHLRRFKLSQTMLSTCPMTDCLAIINNLTRQKLP